MPTWLDANLLLCLSINLLFQMSKFSNAIALTQIYCFQFNIHVHKMMLLSLPNKVWETYCFCSVSYYYYFYYSYSYSHSHSHSLSPFFPRTMNFSTADLRNYWTEFHEILWSYRYMFLVGLKVFSLVVKGVKVICWGVQRGWGLL